MHRRMFLLGAPAALAACGAESIYAPDALVNRYRYVHDGPPSVTLYTMISNDTDAGAHSGLMINASERVMFDPAGSYRFDETPERNDVHFGFTERIRDYYERFHSRITFRVLAQEVIVAPQVAETIYRRALAFGAVPKAQCARSVSMLVQDLPPFERVGVSWFPKSIAADFGRIPGVQERLVFETDDDNKELARAAFEAQVELERKQAAQAAATAN